MSKECQAVHDLLRNLDRHTFPFDGGKLPSNGVYILFEKGEQGHNGDRIVRIGTHNGAKQLQSRLKQHFLNKNKDRSIFRKNIGRAILSRNDDSFLKFWDIDLTTKQAREKYSLSIDLNYKNLIEEEVSWYIQANFSFCVIELDDKSQRLEVESKLISTISLCDECGPSQGWLGNYSPKEKIVASGLWLVNELYKTPFSAFDIDQFSNLIKK